MRTLQGDIDTALDRRFTRGSLDLPTGTELTVRLEQPLSSRTARLEDRFDATVARPVMVDSRVVIAAGTRVQGTVTRAEAALAGLAVVVGALQPHGAQHRLEDLRGPAGIASELSAKARKGRALIVGHIGVKPSLDRTSGHLKCLPTSCCLDRLEVQPVNGARAYELFDLLDDLRLERLLEPPFSAASFEAARPSWMRASHNFSLTSMNS